MVLNARYRLDAELGRGGMGVVYAGHDLLLGRDVAVKLLNKAGLGTEGRNRLLREAQAVARLNHPNIVTLYDAGEADGAPFLVMELLSGISLYERKPANIDELVEIMRQVCAALTHAHEHGIIHRDLKPENVILTGRKANGGAGDLRAKLTDFGLARSATSRETIEGALVGTVYYMPPEQAMGRELDGRADLYSLGVMLYEFAAGRLPFAGDEPLTVIAQHLHAPAVPPSTFNSDIPAALEALILRLLSKQPEERPTNAGEVEHILERIARKSTELILATVETAELSPLDRLVRGRLVGRDAELAEARLAWQNATGDDACEFPHVLLIAGDSGIGKTPFVRALRALAEVSRGRWLHGECYPEGGGPYAAFDQAFGVSTALAESGVLAGLPPWLVGDLVRLAPSLRKVAPDAPESDGDRVGLYESVVAACEALINTPRGRHPTPSPLMLVIEDMQWADPASLPLLRHLARRARSAGLRMLAVLTYRESELSDARGLNDLLLDFTRERLAARIKLEPFDRNQTGELLGVMFQQEISPAFVDEIYRETDGNLFYIEEVCKTLIEDGVLTRAAGRWRFPDELCCGALPQSVKLMVQARIGKLSSSAQEVLRLAAVVGREFDFETLRRAGDLNEDVLIGALEEAQRGQIIAEVRASDSRFEQETFRFVHNLIRTSLLDSISSIRRRRIHRRVGEVIEALRPSEHEALAYHFSMAGDDRRAAAHFRAAGDAAARVYANADAMEAYSNALALIEGDTKERFDAVLARAQVYNVVGRRAEQKADVDVLLALAERLDDDGRRFEALLAQAQYELGTQQLHAREPAEAAIAIARRLGDKAAEGRALICLGLDARLHSDPGRSRPALELAAARLREVGRLDEAASCLMTLSLALGDLAEYGPAFEAVSEAVRLSRQVGNRRLEGTALRRTAIVLMEQRRFAEALPYAEAALALHRAVGERVEECHAHNTLGIIKAYLGRNAEAEGHWRTGIPLAEATESAVAAQFALANITYLHFAWRGEYMAGIALLEDALQRPYLGQNLSTANELRTYIADLKFTLGLHAEALVALPELLATSAALLTQGIIPSIVHGVRRAQYGKLLAEAERFDEARRELDAAFVVIETEGWNARRATALLNWGLGVLRLPEHDEAARAISMTEEALTRYGQAAAWNYDAAAAHRLLAEMMLCRRDAQAAVEHAQTALMVLGLRQYSIELYHLTLARSLRAAGRHDDAADAIGAAYQRVLLVAGRNPDPDIQTAWLERVPANREIIAWWEAFNQPATNPT